MIERDFKVVDVKEIPPVARLYVARRRNDPDRGVEFIDAVDPGVARKLKWIIMVSTQFGCPVGCSMCDVGSIRYRGNLNLNELLFQIRTVFSAHPEIDASTVEKIKLHFARMGEPSLNPAVTRCIEHLARTSRLTGLVPSISTVAPACPVARDFFEELFRIKERYFREGRFQLQFSVHSTDAAARRALIPVRKWNLEDIANVGKKWWRPGDRKVTLNFALAKGVPFDPDVLGRIFDPERFLIKFTPVHPTRRADENGLTENWFVTPPRVARLASEMERRSFSVIVNPPWPEETRGAVSCGQLAACGQEALTC